MAGGIAGFAKRQKAGPLCPAAAGQGSQPCGEIVGDRNDEGPDLFASVALKRLSALN